MMIWAVGPNPDENNSSWKVKLNLVPEVSLIFPNIQPGYVWCGIAHMNGCFAKKS